MEQGTRARETEKRVCRWKLAERHKRVTSHWVLNPLRIWALLMTNSLLWSSISDWNKTSSNWITDFFVFLILTFLWLSFNNGQLYLKSPALDLFRKKKTKKDTGRPEYLTIIPHAGSGYLYWLQNFFRAHWLISLSISWHTYEFMTQRVRANNLIICYCKKKKTTRREFFMRLSCYWQWISHNIAQVAVDFRQLLWQCYGEIRDAIIQQARL